MSRIRPNSVGERNSLLHFNAADCGRVVGKHFTQRNSVKHRESQIDTVLVYLKE